MLRKFILVSLALVLAYAALIQWKLWFKTQSRHKLDQGASEEGETAQRIYSFSFTKYAAGEEKELEIEGDSADILTRNVALMNVIAKAFGEESAVTITADRGTFDKATSEIFLRQNVVATTENGARLMADELDIDPTEKLMETDVETNVKKDNIHVEALGALSDSELRKVTFKRNVTVVVQDPKSDSETPTVITSDGPLVVDYERDIARFSDHVIARDQKGTLTSDYMDVFYDRETRRVSKMIARGNVIIESREGHKTFSDNAIYLADEGRMILGGDVEAEYQKSGSIPEGWEQE